MDNSTVLIGGRNVVLPTRAIADTQLSRRDVFVLAVLATLEDGNLAKRREGWFQIPQSLVARLCGSPRTSVNTSIGKLVRTGYLDRRARINGLGGKEPCEYRIIQDGTLDSTYDRWRHAPDQGRFEWSEPQANQDVELRDMGVEKHDIGAEPQANQDVELRDMGVDIRNKGVDKHDIGAEPQANQDVEVSGNHVEDSNIDSSNKFNRDSTRTSTELFIDGRSNVDFEMVETVVNGFLQLRQNHFPNATTGHSEHGKLLEQAEDFLTRGISVDALLSTLDARMQNHAARGQEAPAGLTRFRQDILTAGKLEQVTGRPLYGRRSGTLPAKAGAAANRGAAVEAADTVPADKWTEAIGLISAADKAGVAKAWLTSAVVVVRDGRAVIRLPSVMARDQVRDAGSIVDAVCRNVLGVDGVEIVHAGAGQSRERRTGGA